MPKRILLETPRFNVCAAEHCTNCQTRTFYYIEKPNAVLVVPHTSSRIVLLRAVRPLLTGPSIEVPGGRIEAGESPLHAAKRELAEECALNSTRWLHLLTSFPLPSVTTEKVHVYSAQVHIPHKWHPRPCPAEGITHITVCSFAEARRYALGGKMKCSLDAYAVLAFLSKVVTLKRTSK
jgi:8-oxo-dGTP pyrophosphatase MutT (NUDIX family)